MKNHTDLHKSDKTVEEAICKLEELIENHYSYFFNWLTEHDTQIGNLRRNNAAHHFDNYDYGDHEDK